MVITFHENLKDINIQSQEKLISRSSERVKFSGGYSCRATPVPIPNTEVKSATSMILGWRRPGKADTAGIN